MMNHSDEDGAYQFHDQQKVQFQTQHPNKPYNRYKECLKNHAASMGGNALDGCGEFMPSNDDREPGCGDNNPFEALKCSVCGCHRNFHRKEVGGETSHHQSPLYDTNNVDFWGRKKAISGGHHNSLQMPIATTTLQMTMQVGSPNAGGASTPSESNDHGDGDGFVVMPAQRKKRHRTKFSQEQKGKLLGFAEKAGWKMQKLDESVVQQFCQEIGIKRKVLKVWMHNNKQHYVSKNLHF